MDLSPLRRRDFRLLYLGQTVSFFGSMMSYVALPYVLYQATKSTVLTGVLGVIQLVPSVVGGLLGGTLADAMDRRKLIVICETGMALVVLAVAATLSALAPAYPRPGFLLGASAALAIFNGFHRPALEALTPRLVEAHEQPAASMLSSFRNNLGMIGGPALAGVLLSSHTALVFYLDVLSFVICVGCLLAMRDVPKAPLEASLSGEAMREGFRYAASRQELVGTYVVDIVAMTFSMPNLLFPAVAEALGAQDKLGWLHVGLASGALVATLTAHRFIATRRHGLVILCAAFAWSCCMIGFGLARQMPVALLWLLFAGYADMISGVYRLTIWNQTIPDALRGRLAGIEMISYLSGPMLGNTQLGVLAKLVGVQRAVAWSSVAGAVGVVTVAWLLPHFRGYVAPLHANGSEEADAGTRAPTS
jgi:MFS family permease